MPPEGTEQDAWDNAKDGTNGGKNVLLAIKRSTPSQAKRIKTGIKITNLNGETGI